MRATLILIVAAVLGFFGYQYGVNQRTPMEAINALSGPASDAADAATDTATDAVEGAADAATGAVEAVTEAADEAADAATGAVEAVTEAVEDAADDATQAVQAATEGAAGAATQATEEVSTGPAVPPVQEAAPVVSDTPPVAPAGFGDVETLLTPEGFDADRVIEMIDGAELNPVIKTTLTTAINAAKDNPDLLQGALDQVRAAMGL